MKDTLDDLAILGGRRRFSRTLHAGCPNVVGRHLPFHYLNDMLERRWLSNNGPYVQQLERCIADLLGVDHCIATCNGTAALEIAVRALGLAGEVIVPSFTFVATAHALQ